MKAWLDKLTDDECVALEYNWKQWWARANQLTPDPFVPGTDIRWLVWIILAGRGFGKTRTGAEFIRDEVEAGRMRRIALIGPTAADVRDVMIEGESGILSISPPWNKPVYEPSKRRLTWPNGALATAFSADEPERLRGPQHDGFWGDELASWRYAEAWDMLMFGMRLGDNPRGVVTTTPKPIKLLREILAAKTTIITRGSTYDNRDNLAAAFFQSVVTKYEGSRLGRQELNAELLDDVPGALWTYAMLDACRFKLDSSKLDADDPTSVLKQLPQMSRVVVAIDPSGTKGPSQEYSNEDKSNDVGITVCGKGIDGHGYLLADLTCNAAPAVWGRIAVNAYHRWQADRVIAERNFGGAMVGHVIRSVDRMVPYREVTASRGKAIRAEPVASLYEQKKIHHVGAFPACETQMTQMTTNGYTGDGSPDRLDAAVWGFTDLLLSGRIPPPAVVLTASYTR